MRLFMCEKESKKGFVSLTGKDFHRLRRVLRKKVGDRLSLTLKNGEFSSGEIVSIEDKKSTLLIKLLEETNENGKKSRKTHAVTAREVTAQTDTREWNLFQFIARTKTMERITRQATECGVKNIIPIIGEYTQMPYVKSIKEKERRLCTIINEARTQSASPVQTKIFPPMTLGEALEFWKGINSSQGKKAFFMWEHEDTERAKLLSEGGETQCVALAVGSEGGISESEAKELKKADFVPLHIRGNILRSDTAAVYSLAFVRALLEMEGRKNGKD